MRTFGSVSNTTKIQVWWADAVFAGQLCVAFGLPRRGLVRFGLMLFDDLCNSAFGAFGKSGLLWVIDVLLEGQTLHRCTRKKRIFAESSRPEDLNLVVV